MERVSLFTTLLSPLIPGIPVAESSHVCVGLAYIDREGIKGKRGAAKEGYGVLLRCQVNIVDMPQGDRRRATGYLGPMAQESAQVAISWVIRRHEILVEWLGGQPLDLENEGIHLHVEGFVASLDGPSIGAAFIITIVGYLTDRKIKNTMAITGDINLRGEVMSVSGISEKVEAARRAGISRVLIPAVNMDRWDSSKDSLDPILRAYGDAALHPISHIFEALELMLDGKQLWCHSSCPSSRCDDDSALQAWSNHRMPISQQMPRH